jgi:monoamine oxidase
MTPDPTIPTPRRWSDRTVVLVGDPTAAGTETVHDHPGHLDGAIEAGLRAAGEVVPGGRT